MKRLIFILLFLTATAGSVVGFSPVSAQVPGSGLGQVAGQPLSLSQVIALAQRGSVDAMVVRNNFLSSYWSFRSHRAELLPSLNFSASVVQFDRSQRALQDPYTGEINYRTNYNMNNSGTLSIDQNIASTGGTLSLSSSLNRLDQYRPARSNTWYSQPVTLTYMQPLFAYNRLKWDNKIEPERFEKAKRDYLEAMESVTIKAVQYFYRLAVAQLNYDIARGNYGKMKTMFDIARRRHNETGSVTRAELLQLELRMLNDSLSILTQGNNFKAQQMEFCSFLGFNEETSISLELAETVPDVQMDLNFVMGKAVENGSFEIAQRIAKLDAERAVAQAKANRGITVSANTQFGLSNSGNDLAMAYRGLLEREVFGLTLRVPIMDWGMGRGRVKMAQAQYEVAMANARQAVADFKQQIYLDVAQFNAQRDKLDMSRRASDIAQERYDLAMKDFAAGSISVTELNTAQGEKDSATVSYINEMSNFWNYYFTLRKATLYDFASGIDISAEYDKLVK